MIDDRPGLSASDECTTVPGEHGWDDEAAVQASLDAALEDLLRAAVAVGSEPYAVSCARIDQAFDQRMAPYQHLTWARLLAEGLKMQLKLGLHRHLPSSDTVREIHCSKLADLAAPSL